MVVAPLTTSRKISWLIVRAGADSSLNGFDADDGSAATRKNFPANAWYGSIAVTPVLIAACSRVPKSLFAARCGATASRCATWMRV